MTTFASTIRAGVLGVALAGAAAAWPAYACGEERNEGSKQSDIGAVTGLAVGAAAGGPPGAVLGAAAGALLGGRYPRPAPARAGPAARSPPGAGRRRGAEERRGAGRARPHRGARQDRVDERRR